MKGRHFILCLICVFCACDSLFTTREPERPINPQSNWTPPYTAQDVQSNLMSSFYERNSDNFIRCLADPAYHDRSFYFEPDPAIMTQYGHVFASWSRESEIETAQLMFSLVPSDSVAYLTFPGTVNEVISADTTVFVLEYHMELHHSRALLDDVRFSGQVEFRLAPDQRGQWAIYYWKDTQQEGQASWSYLKAVLGS